VAAPTFFLFQDRLLGSAHVITLAPPRPDGGKHIIEARVTGGVSYVEHYEDADEAAGRYLSLAALLLDDPSITKGSRRQAAQRAAAITPAEAAGEDHLAPVTPLLSRQ
jgi:hypothetical protein